MSYYNYDNESEKQKENDDDSLATIGKAVGAVAGAALAAWGIAKLFTASSEESSSSSKSQSMANNKQPVFASPQGTTLQVDTARRFMTFNEQPTGIPSGQASTAATRVLKWSPPKKGWLKLNTAATATKYPVVVGGVFRDDEGQWVCGFARKIEDCPPKRTDLAELWAIQEGLETAVIKRFKKNIEIETDSEAALGHLKDGRVSKNDFQAIWLVKACQDLIKKLSPWSVELQFLNGKANGDAHKVADLGRSLCSEKTTYFTSEPEFASDKWVPKWSLPKKGWLKLNTDASCRTSSKPPSVAIGGVIRNDNGRWVAGFARRIKDCPAGRNDLAELCAIREGLETALEMGYDNIEIETDSTAALNHLKSGRVSSDDLQRRLVKDCQDLMKEFSSPSSIKLQHVEEDGNKVADKMADLGHRLGFEKTKPSSTPPEEVVFLYKREIAERSPRIYYI